MAIELIVVDDGSTDETGNVLRQIHDDRLILIEQDN
ncbi:glycosyltransferase [Klebsiella pneumoniae]